MFHTGSRGRTIGAAAVVALSTVGVAQAGVNTWSEAGDAGQNGVGAAQETLGFGPLELITGTLSNRNDVDLFCIHISDFTLFRAQVTAFAGTDSVLWLFNADGTLQTANDDTAPGNLLSTITNQGVFSNGIYYLGISRFANEPQNAANAFLIAGSWPGPDFGQLQGNANILDHWDDNTNPNDAGGAYSIVLRGAEYCPTPGAAALLGMGGLVVGRRRR